MKISYITCTLNNDRTLPRTMQSVIELMTDSDEYIIIDGGSTDDTLSIVKDFQGLKNNIRLYNNITGGVYSALNFGITNSNGQIIGIIHADDYYFVEAVCKVFECFTAGYDIVYGNVLKSNARGEQFLSKPNFGDALLGWFNVNEVHPSVFVKKYVYDQVGLFDEGMRITADLDFLIRAYRNGLSFGYLDETVAYQEYGGLSSQLKLVSVLENIKIAKINNFKFGTLGIVLKKIAKWVAR
jgi:glycosyltransferase involved in cell wall biosynthesis